MAVVWLTVKVLNVAMLIDRQYVGTFSQKLPSLHSYIYMGQFFFERLFSLLFSCSSSYVSDEHPLAK